MSFQLVELKCPTCGHVWHKTLAELRNTERVIYRDAKRPPNQVSYRVQCPVDHTYVIVDVIEEAQNE